MKAHYKNYVFLYHLTFKLVMNYLSSSRLGLVQVRKIRTESGLFKLSWSKDRVRTGSGPSFIIMDWQNFPSFLRFPNNVGLKNFVFLPLAVTVCFNVLVQDRREFDWVGIPWVRGRV